MGGQDKSVVFCLDVSGSMCVSEAIKGKFKIKGDRTKQDMRDLMKFSAGSNQLLTRAERNVTYVSRIQCVKAAVEAQLKEMAVGAANRKVGVVTFNNDVTVIGDGTKDP